MSARRLLALALVASCQPATSRPTVVPLPEALASELRLSVPETTRRFAESLKADSIPTGKVRLRDGYIETPWFNSRTGRPTSATPAVGTATVKIRAWADPARPGSTQLTVETLYRPAADPSLPDRELERQVPRDHPVARKVEAALGRLVERFGAPPPPQVQQPAAISEGDE
ncbi:MAG TPA: hypothetical protein VJ808_14495 [Gemmatimonadales bacterium]|nr:hypothetical protein [Gemmatimonadales bacterium]